MNSFITTNKRFKVLWLSHLIPYPPKGGVLIRSYNLVREVAKHHDVDLFAFNQGRLLRAYFSDEAEGLSAAHDHLSSICRRYHVEDIPAEHRRFGKELLALQSLFTRHPYTINWLKSTAAKAKLNEWLDDGGYDVVHFDTISLAPYFDARIVCPTVMDHHNVESHMMLRRSEQEKNPIKRAYYYLEGRRLRSYERKHLGAYDAHIVCSSDDRGRLLDVDRSLNVSVVPNGIDMSADVPARNPSKSSKQLLFVGGLDWYPNADAIRYFLSEVWPGLTKVCPDVEIDIVGKNPPRDIVEYSRADVRIRVHGFVEDISKLYECAAVYICPIRDGGGTKLKVLDALAHRLPMVAHSIACEGINVEDSHHLLVADSPVEMTDAIVKLLSSEVLAKSLGNAGYELIKNHYNFERIGFDLASLYTELYEKQIH